MDEQTDAFRAIVRRRLVVRKVKLTADRHSDLLIAMNGHVRDIGELRARIRVLEATLDAARSDLTRSIEKSVAVNREIDEGVENVEHLATDFIEWDFDRGLTLASVVPDVGMFDEREVKREDLMTLASMANGSRKDSAAAAEDDFRRTMSGVALRCSASSTEISTWVETVLSLHRSYRLGVAHGRASERPAMDLFSYVSGYSHGRSKDEISPLDAPGAPEEQAQRLANMGLEAQLDTVTRLSALDPAKAWAVLRGGWGEGWAVNLIPMLDRETLRVLYDSKFPTPMARRANKTVRREIIAELRKGSDSE